QEHVTQLPGCVAVASLLDEDGDRAAIPLGHPRHDRKEGPELSLWEHRFQVGQGDDAPCLGEIGATGRVCDLDVPVLRDVAPGPDLSHPGRVLGPEDVYAGRGDDGEVLGSELDDLLGAGMGHVAVPQSDAFADLFVTEVRIDETVPGRIA